MKNYPEWAKSLDTRRVLYALFILDQKVDGIVIQDNSAYLASIVKELDEAMEFDILKNMEEEVKIGLLDDSEIVWLRDDLRAAIWFGIYYNKTLFCNYPAPVLMLHRYYPSYIDNLILNIDAFTIDIDAELRTNQTLFYNKLTLKNTPTDVWDTPHLNYVKIMEDQKKIDSPQENSEVLTPIKPDTILPPARYTVKSASQGLKYKKARLDYAKILYETFAKTKDKDISWIEKDNKTQLLWAIEYLKKNLGFLLTFLPFTPKDDEELYQQICALLDAYTLQQAYYQEDNRVVLDNTAEKELFIQKMRNSWNQKNFRDKKDIDSAMQSFLRKKTHKQLIEIADSYGVSIREVLEDLIKNEHGKL